MDVSIDSLAWFSKKDLGPTQLMVLRRNLTVTPRKVGDFPGEDPQPIKLYVETPERIGIARQYFLNTAKAGHRISYNVTEGDNLPSPFRLSCTLRDEQKIALGSVVSQLTSGTLGGILRAAPGWGKSCWSCALMAALQVPTLIVVHKEFLVNQWVKRIGQFLPEARIGRVQQDECDYEGKHVVIGMVHSLAGKQYPSDLYRAFGLVVNDEVHRIGAATWAQVPSLFSARWRLGLSATVRRKDGADNVFYYHIGQILFTAREQMLAPKIRRVETSFSLFKTPSFNPNLASKAVLLKFLCGSPQRNRLIVDQLILAVLAGRKILVLSERLAHLDALHTLLCEMWPKSDPMPSVGRYVGGMKKEELEVSERCSVILATTQLTSEGLDIPSMDTLFLTCPMGDVEQSVGRIQKVFPGKKEPVVVDFIDRKVPYCIRSSEYRQKFYVRKGWIT